MSPTPKASDTSRAKAPKPRTAAQGKVAKPLPGATTGKASAAKAEVGDAPVQAYIASLPRGVDLEKASDMDDRQLAAWIKQASRHPGLGAGKA